MSAVFFRDGQHDGGGRRSGHVDRAAIEPFDAVGRHGPFEVSHTLS
ncbi:hypothetical protein [Gordonia westfalica]|nr:hypothetical protein [Gordonia westfalica]